MADNFDMRKYLVENHLGPFAVLGQVAESPEEETTSETEIKEEEQMPDVNALVSTINAAKKAGKEITVNGEPVTMWIAMIGRLKTKGGTYNVHDVMDGSVELTIDGEKVAPPMSAKKKEEPFIDKRSPEQIARDKAAWQDRYGPGGGYDTPAGRRTFDESVNETSMEALDRMEGLVSQSAMGTMLHGARGVIRSLKEEGFEDEEIFDYIMQEIKTL